jgi:hypothetical protein
LQQLNGRASAFIGNQNAIVWHGIIQLYRGLSTLSELSQAEPK